MAWGGGLAGEGSLGGKTCHVPGEIRYYKIRCLCLIDYDRGLDNAAVITIGLILSVIGPYFKSSITGGDGRIR